MVVHVSHETHVVVPGQLHYSLNFKFDVALVVGAEAGCIVNYFLTHMFFSHMFHFQAPAPKSGIDLVLLFDLPDEVSLKRAEGRTCKELYN